MCLIKRSDVHRVCIWGRDEAVPPAPPLHQRLSWIQYSRIRLQLLTMYQECWIPGSIFTDFKDPNGSKWPRCQQRDIWHHCLSSKYRKMIGIYHFGLGHAFLDHRCSRPITCQITLPCMGCQTQLFTYVESVLLILIQNLDVAASKTLLDFITKFPRIMRLVTIQTERTVAMQMEIWAFIGSVALSMSRQQADDVIAWELKIAEFRSTSYNHVNECKKQCRWHSPARRLEISDLGSRAAWWNFLFGLRLERRQDVPHKQSAIPHTLRGRSPICGW